MANTYLTKDAKKLLYILYKEYLNRRKHNVAKTRATDFDSASSVQFNFMPNELLEDVEEYMRELGRNDFLENFYADDTIYSCYLTDYAICTMETLPKDTLVSVANFISQFLT